MKKDFIKSRESDDYTVFAVCNALEISRSTYYRYLNYEEKENKKSGKKRDYTEIVQLMKEILSMKRYCTYGYRRVHIVLKKDYNKKIGDEKVRELMRENGLSQPHHCRRKGYKKVKKPVVTGPNQYWQIDMTIGYLSNSTPIYTIGIKDVFTREIVGLKGYYRARSIEWLDCLNNAIMDIFPEGKPLNSLVLGSDNGCQPTSKKFRGDCSNLDIDIRYSGYKNPKENGSIERFFRTLKEEHLWLNQFDTLEEYNQELDDFKDFYNKERYHSSIGYQSPYEFKENYFDNQKLDKKEEIEYNNYCLN